MAADLPRQERGTHYCFSGVPTIRSVLGKEKN